MERLVQDMLSNAMAVTVLAAVVAILGRTCRRPALIHSLCLLALVKLITPPVVPVRLPILARAAAAGPTEPAKIVAAEPRDEPPVEIGTARSVAEAFTGPVGVPRSGETPADNPSLVIPPREDSGRGSILAAVGRWEPLVLGLVLAGALGWWSLAVARIVRFHRVLRQFRPVTDDWQARTDELAGRLGLQPCAAVCLVPGEVPPMLWALGTRPRLLVPLKLWANLGEPERTALLLHELAHLKRRDHWVRWLELFVAGLYWWHPVVWWLRRALREAEEQCCDAWVVWAMPQNARTYAAALLAALEFVSGARTTPAAGIAPATLGNGHVSCLKRRLRMIVRAKTPKRLSWAGRLAVMGLAALLLPLAPSWAQKDTTEPARTDLDRRADRVDQLVQDDLKSLEPHEALARVEMREWNLERELGTVDEALKGIRRIAKNPDKDPAGVVYRKRRDDLVQEYNRLQDTKRTLLAQLRADDKDDTPKESQGRETAERIEAHLKELIEKLGKELGPVGDEVRKALERAVGEVHRSLQKEGMTADDLSRALDRSREELRKSFRSGGPVEKEMREALERARKDMSDAMERGRQEMERARERMREEMQSRREDARKRAEEAREAARGRERNGSDLRSLDRAKSKREETEKAEGPANRQELEAARRQIRELEQRLRTATRRLEELQRREATRGDRPRRGATPPEAPARSRPPEPPQPPATTRPAPPREAAPGPRGNPNERRLRELEEKMDRLLRELENLKREKTVRSDFLR